MRKNHEKVINSLIVGDNDISPILGANIDQSYFFEGEEQAVFKLIRNFYAKYGRLPSENYIHQFFPSYEFQFTGDEFDPYIELLQQTKFNDEFAQLHRKLMDVKREAPLEERVVLLQEGAKLLGRYTVARKQAINLAESGDSIISEYRSEVVWGVPYPWPTLLERTLGLVDGELTLFYGRPGSKKTFLMCYVAAYLALKGYSWIFCSREMRPQIIRRRIACCMAGVNYTRYLKRRLTQDEERKLFAMANRLKDLQDCYVFGREDVGDTVSSLNSVLEAFQFVDGVLNDGVYLMRDDVTGQPALGNWEAMGNIIWGLKDLALRKYIPILNTSQENRASEQKKVSDRSLAGISFSDAIGMTVDVAIKIKAFEDIELIGTKIREGTMPENIYLWSRMCENIKEKTVNKYALLTT